MAGQRGDFQQLVVRYQDAFDLAEFELNDDLRALLNMVIAGDRLGAALFGPDMTVLDAVCAAVALADCARSIVSDLIFDAINEGGHSWEEVGAALGISGEEADETYWVEIGGRSREDPQRIITRAHAAGASLRTICDLLNQRNIPSPGGKRWHPTTVNRVLHTNPNAPAP